MLVNVEKIRFISTTSRHTAAAVVCLFIHLMASNYGGQINCAVEITMKAPLAVCRAVCLSISLSL